MAEAYAICNETKCKRPVYTAKQIDEMFEVAKNLVVLKTSASVASKSSKSVTVNYPEGLNPANCLILASGYGPVDTNSYLPTATTLTGGKNSNGYTLSFEMKNNAYITVTMVHVILFYKYA